MCDKVTPEKFMNEMKRCYEFPWPLQIWGSCPSGIRTIKNLKVDFILLKRRGGENNESQQKDEVLHKQTNHFLCNEQLLFSRKK